MKKNVLHIIITITVLLGQHIFVTAQIDANLLLGLHLATTAQMNSITGATTGLLIYNTTESDVFQYNGTSWEKVGGNTIGNNIYENDGTLTGSRFIDMGTNNLNITSTGGDFNIDTNSLHIDASTDRIGIGTNSPSVKLDVNGQTRLRSIPNGSVSDDLLTTDSNGNIKKVKQPTTNKSYVQVYKTSKSFSNGNAVLLNLFPEVTIQAGKKVRLDLYVPTRDNTTSWGGLYVNVNAKVNGTWYNLGNTGYDGGVMHSSATSIHALNHEMLLDFITNLNLPDDQDYTLQIELTARSYNGTTYVNRNHDINRTANNLGSRGALQTWASDQNYCHIIIAEKDR